MKNNRRLTIVIPTQKFTDNPTTGLRTVVYNTAVELAHKGHNVHVFAVEVELVDHTIQNLKQQNIFIHPIPGIKDLHLSRTSLFLMLIELVKLRFQTHIDWIYVLDTIKTPFLRWKFGAKLAQRKLAPPTPSIRQIIFSAEWIYDRKRKYEEANIVIQNISLWYRVLSVVANKLIVKLYRHYHINKEASILFCQNQITLKYFNKRFPGKCVYLPNGVACDNFKKSTTYKLKRNSFNFLFVGRIAKRKGIFSLVNAFKKIHLKYNKTTLYIIGSGSDKLTQELKAMIGNELNKSIFLLGRLSRKRTISTIKSCDALVDPMIYAGFSTVVAEGMFAQKPVIAPKYGGSPDLITHQENGLLVDSRKQKSLIQNMIYILENPEKRKSMAKKAHITIKNNFCWSKVIDIVESAFHKYENSNSY